MHAPSIYDFTYCNVVHAVFHFLCKVEVFDFFVEVVVCLRSRLLKLVYVVYHRFLRSKLASEPPY